MASAPKVCPKGVVVELKREIVEGKGGKQERREKVADWPSIFSRPTMLGLHLIPTSILHFILLLSCSLH
jgi:hypothetical protein